MAEEMAQELVLVVRRDALRPPLDWRGIREGGAAEYVGQLRALGTFGLRSAMEADPRFKQIIPYLILRDGPRVFLMHRTAGGGDPRLHDRYSIGVGGHLNPGDRDIPGGLRREWAEELVAGFTPDFRLLGLLNDDSTDVGRVHLGVVYLADAAGAPVAVRETTKLSGGFVALEEVERVRDGLETWSRLVLDVLTGGPAP